MTNRTKNQTTATIIRGARTAWLVAALTMAVIVSSCSADDSPAPQPEPPVTYSKTLFVYMPWSSNLTSFFLENIADLKRAIAANGLNGERVIVFMASSASEATMKEIVCQDGQCSETILKQYSSPAFTTAEGITQILNDMKAFAPAETYSMIIGGHGTGWLPVYRADAAKSAMAAPKYHWDNDPAMSTRFFGGLSSEYQTDISTLAEGIADTGTKMEFILFDDCYMSSVEVAYELRDVTSHIIACPTEIMNYGMPYEKIGPHLLGEPDYEAVCDGFLSFYSDYVYPYGTIAVTDCAELDSLARLMGRINSGFVFDPVLRGGLQRMDGYAPVIFYDLGDYVNALCTDTELLADFNRQLSRTVPHKACTARFPTGGYGTVAINAYSGITTSAPTTSSYAAAWTQTSWYAATH